MLKVPSVSISRTVLKPLEDIFAAEAKKLPAAPLTNTSSLPNFSTAAATTLLQSSGFLTSPASEMHEPY